MSLRRREDVVASGTPTSHWGHAPQPAYDDGRLSGWTPVRGGIPHWHRPMSTSRVPADQDGTRPQRAGVDPQMDLTSVPQVPFGWIYTPLLGSNSAGLAFFHKANPNRTIVQFGPHHLYNFTGGVYYPEPCQFDDVVLKDVDIHVGKSLYTVKVAGKEGAETACWMQIVGQAPPGEPVRLLWYEIFNQRSRTSLTIDPADQRYDLADHGAGQGFRGLSFSTGTALVCNKRIQEMDLTRVAFSSMDEGNNEKKVKAARRIWAKFREDMILRTMYTVEKMDQNHMMVRDYLGGELAGVYDGWKVDVNDIPY